MVQRRPTISGSLTRKTLSRGGSPLLLDLGDRYYGGHGRKLRRAFPSSVCGMPIIPIAVSDVSHASVARDTCVVSDAARSRAGAANVTPDRARSQRASSEVDAAKPGTSSHRASQQLGRRSARREGGRSGPVPPPPRLRRVRRSFAKAEASDSRCSTGNTVPHEALTSRLVRAWRDRELHTARFLSARSPESFSIRSGIDLRLCQRRVVLETGEMTRESCLKKLDA